MDMQTERLKETYNPEGSALRNLQLRMLEILKSVDAICKKHNIPYWLSSGTLLGAVRHDGFIPWDDDIDIELLREDYLKLLDILPKELPEEYVLQTTDTDSGYVYLYAKVRDTNSYIEEKCVFNKHFEYKGAFIDIFPLEPTYKIFSKQLTWYNHQIEHLDAGNNLTPEKEKNRLYGDVYFKTIFWHRFIYTPEKNRLVKLWDIACITYYLTFTLLFSLTKCNCKVLKAKWTALIDAYSILRSEKYKSLSRIMKVKGY